MRKIKKVLSLMMVFIIAATLCACGVAVEQTGSTEESTSDEQNEIKEYTQDENEFVLGVKGGSPNSYPDISYEEAFGFFFSNPTWRYFEGTREDDDNTYNVVEFTGGCLYEDVEVTVLIQFTISEDFKTFDGTYFSMNDVPQPLTELDALIESAFSKYQETQELEGNKAVPKT